MGTLLEPIADIGEEEGPEDVHMRTMVEGSATGGRNKRKPEEPADVVDGEARSLRSRKDILQDEQRNIPPFVIVPPFPIESSADKKHLARSRTLNRPAKQ